MDLSFIQKVRKNKDLSIKELAKLSNISERRLSKIEKNETPADLNEIISLTTILDYKIVAQDKINTHTGQEFELVK